LANFKRTTFSGTAHFRGALFSDVALFDRATFSEEAIFEGATFSNWASFQRTAFADFTDFNGATFASRAHFSNAQFEGETSFEAATFSAEPPTFFGAKLHEGTVWRHVKWPRAPKNPFEAEKFIDAYERLKLEMDRLKKHEDELAFFALELKSRGPSLPIAFYGVLSDYGRSYIRPLVALFVTVAVGAVLFLPHFGLSRYPLAIGLSVANTVGVLGFRKDFINPQVIDALSRALKVVSAVQTVAGIVSLFFFGLAVRNRFRMK
jgi:hypothetical protein